MATEPEPTQATGDQTGNQTGDQTGDVGQPAAAKRAGAKPEPARDAPVVSSPEKPEQAEAAAAEPATPKAGAAEPAPAKAAGARRASTKAEPEAASAKPRRSGRDALDLLRSRIAKVVGLLCVLAALILALGVVLVALRKNVTETNSVVKAVFDLADVVDGPFSRDRGMFSFASETKNALANWGLAAVVYLVLGRVLSAVIGPRH